MDQVFKELTRGVIDKGPRLRKLEEHERSRRTGKEPAEDDHKKNVTQLLPQSLDFFATRKKSIKSSDEASNFEKDTKNAVKELAPQGKAVEHPDRTTKKRYRVRTEQGLPSPMLSFEHWRLGVPFKAVSGSLVPTEIQAQAAPCIAQKMEVIAVAPTGSGKTLAYVVPLVKRAAEREKKVRAPRCLILVPTRELAEQIGRVLKLFLQNSYCKDWVSLKLALTKAHMSGLAGGGAERADFLVATPMRLIHSIRAKAVNLGNVEDLVLDEADKMFEDGFISQIDEVLNAIGNCRLHLFSATLPPKVEQTARTIMKVPVKIVVGGKNYGGGTAAVDASTVAQRFMFADGQGEAGKVTAFRRLLAEGLMPPTLVFVQSQERASQLFKELVYDGVNIDAIHASRTQAQRESAIESFRSGKVWILIATDLMARGIDFRTINTVINYDIPPTAAAYVHRIGRTGRAGKTGTAITFFTEQDKPMLRKLANVAVASGAEIPSWMLEVKGNTRLNNLEMEKRPPKRARVGSSGAGVPATKHGLKQKRKGKKAKRGKQSNDGED